MCVRCSGTNIVVTGDDSVQYGDTCASITTRMTDNPIINNCEIVFNTTDYQYLRYREWYQLVTITSPFIFCFNKLDFQHPFLNCTKFSLSTNLCDVCEQDYVYDTGNQMCSCNWTCRWWL